MSIGGVASATLVMFAVLLVGAWYGWTLVTETPILDQLRTAYGQDYLDTIPKPLGRVSDPAEQAAVLAFLGSRAAGYITGQVIWVDGGNLAARQATDFEKG